MYRLLMTSVDHHYLQDCHLNSEINKKVIPQNIIIITFISYSVAYYNLCSDLKMFLHFLILNAFKLSIVDTANTV